VSTDPISGKHFSLDSDAGVLIIFGLSSASADRISVLPDLERILNRIGRCNKRHVALSRGGAVELFLANVLTSTALLMAQEDAGTITVFVPLAGLYTEVVVSESGFQGKPFVVFGPGGEIAT
jgi:hypothetical protein